MPVFNPPYLGLVFRKSDATTSSIEAHKAHWARLIKKFGGDFNEDENLIGFSVAMSGPDLDYQITEAQAKGAVLGQDFVATSSVDGIIGVVPSWLSVRNGEHGLEYSLAASEA